MTAEPVVERGTSAAAGDGPVLSPAEFGRFQALIYREAGIHLADCKQALLSGRLSRRVRELGLRSYGAYFQRVADGGDPEERRRMLEAVCTHETHFFREAAHWEFLSGDLLPRWRADAAARRRPRRVRAWSAGCSSGEEPYSLAMTLLDALPDEEGWQVEVVATDLSRRVLDQAAAGLWRVEKAAEIPERLRRAYMLRGRGAQEGRMAAGDEVRRVVRFQQLNLNDREWALQGRFDLVFCRNVLIYFDARSRAGVVGRLLERLEPGGHLFVGHAESLTQVTPRLRTVLPTVYTHADQAAPARRERIA
ncbi:MAG: Protein-glutamate O-methyltransferase [Gemmatimonadetes bacterium]|nr:Protein-glutamate O-methyltransferase [Gemmatimonadota bacterium]